MKRIIVLLIVVLTSTFTFVNAQAPKYSDEFLDIGVSARALAMGNSVVASTDDVTSGYWNPAGLLDVKSNLEFSLMHAEYFAGIAKYDYGAISYKIDSVSAFGFTAIRFGVDDIPNTTQLIDANGNVDYNNITSFSAADYGFLFSYARRIGIPGLELGANVKIVRRVVGDFAGAWGFGFDVGAKYKYKNWLFGAVARDVTSTFNAWSYNLSSQMEQVFQETGNVIPSDNLEVTLPRLLLGAGRKFSFFHDNVSLLAELGTDITFDGKRNTVISTNPVSVDPHIGFEIGYKGFIFLRGGINNIQNSTDVAGNPITTFQPDFGVGIKIKSFTLDYALTNIGDASVALYSNIFSIKFDINKKT
ncbi:MAG: PorV/PorQ family protein [Alphaproteobacteria bacterium]